MVHLFGRWVGVRPAVCTVWQAQQRFKAEPMHAVENAGECHARHVELLRGLCHGQAQRRQNFVA